MSSGVLAPLYECGINELRNETKILLKQVSPSDITTLCLSKNEATLKIFEENEIEFKGKRYDVVSTQNRNDSMVFQCVEDRAEQHMIESYNNLVNYTSESSNNPSKEKSGFIKINSAKDYIKEQICSLLPQDKNCIYSYSNFIIPVGVEYHSCTFPPPKLVRRA
jgi:hypothetical protein